MAYVDRQTSLRPKGCWLMSTFRLSLLPASDGDCMILSWGEVGQLHHMIIDGGRTSAYSELSDRLSLIVQEGGSLDLYVLTHIDGDHIGGALSYLRDEHRPIAPEAVWFNGYREIKGGGRRSMKQGDDYSSLLRTLEWPLNDQFETGVVTVETDPGDIDIAGLRIRILSPYASNLEALATRWDELRKLKEQEEELARRDANGRRGARKEKTPIPSPIVLDDLIADGETDTEVPNGSSIAFVAEWSGRRVLLTGDAHPDVLVRSLGPLAVAEGGRYAVDLLKAPHHGSRKNTSRPLIEVLDCRNMAISTNGIIHGHPDPQSIARFLHYGVEGSKSLHFNYATPRTLPWGSAETQSRYDYVANYPDDEAPGVIEIDLLAMPGRTTDRGE